MQIANEESATDDSLHARGKLIQSTSLLHSRPRQLTPQRETKPSAVKIMLHYFPWTYFSSPSKLDTSIVVIVCY